ncbi:type II toxin-antitoxin system Phd/YefM family antitoxin [Mesorhizobium sp. M1E.F.Ca.ET.045.02.1.1]|uniref:type II toxin-antitoxin system Phd/YefM family antitoxin n=1 Tax=Mesorhizobium sp. M1E.F.Ca.ET.045.02.1.1 TaxID=2493672 RepID=UPI000F75ADCC|nr:type II toxin-antitoxin system Phd/YefM family antitoxin [Mesorhizobium sp. M1E.F.Ca.ET.045.02.1.1]AZO25020.1 type II toxin-antitoxin system Phd/YefM family antitoxin [Mesorhizobium sp. M1E.F.Ca.ET.045.02.1.1]TKB17576.1 MAG: type II toxin-antitoxin system Phd/YefM family antitoxin [Mesorhizobium sp.]
MTTTVTATADSKIFGAYQDAAVRDQVIITKNGRLRTVLLAYEEFVRLSKRDRRVELTAELSADQIAAVEASEMAPDLDHLNDELPRVKTLWVKTIGGNRPDGKKCCRLK